MLQHSRRLTFSYLSPYFQCLRNNSAAALPACIMSGLQPTGVPHIGNYLGAIRPLVNMQKQYTNTNIIVCIVDLHSITIPKNANDLRSNIRSMAASLIACGIDPERCIIFQQSEVSQHSELAWVLTCMTPMTRVLHLPQWKEKSENVKDVSLGLLSYPVLQAADVLIYKASDVPVGDDQVKHMELVRDLAKSFNRTYKTHFFPIPRALTGSSDRIRSLRNPSKKMSKSDEDAKSRIELLDSDDTIREKFRKAVTDTISAITYDPTVRPGVSNLVDIHCAISGLTVEQACEQSRQLNTLQYKTLVADIVIEHLRPIRERAERLLGDPAHLSAILTRGSDRARAIAADTCDGVKKLVGFR